MIRLSIDFDIDGDGLLERLSLELDAMGGIEGVCYAGSDIQPTIAPHCMAAMQRHIRTTL